MSCARPSPRWATLSSCCVVQLPRIRQRAKTHAIPEDERYFLIASANALIVSIVGFLVGGAFIALSLNDLTWYTFALVAALDRLSVSHVVSASLKHEVPVGAHLGEEQAANVEEFGRTAGAITRVGDP